MAVKKRTTTKSPAGGKKTPRKAQSSSKSARPAAAKSRVSSRGKSTARRTPTSSRRPAPKKKKAAKRVLRPNPEALKLARSIAQAALDKKAEDVMILDVRAKGSLVGYDYLVLASGDTERQLTAIADAMDDALRPSGRKATSSEASSDWVLVNYDDVIAHLFTPEKRAVYDIEGFWSDSPRIEVFS